LKIGSNKTTLASVNNSMSDWPEPTKFDKLRIKTETQLVQLIDIEINLGIQDARQALKAADTRSIREAHSRRANKAYVMTKRLLPLVVDITEDERRGLESKLEYLHRMLGVLSAIQPASISSEGEIANLARAVWEARGSPQGLPEEDWFRAERALKGQRESNTACFPVTFFPVTL